LVTVLVWQTDSDTVLHAWVVTVSYVIAHLGA